MNYYLIEPYNPYQKSPRKRHWMEIAEEEAMYARIVAESLKNSTHPSDSPPIAQATVAGHPAAAAGAGGVPEVEFFQRTVNGTYIASAITDPAPLTVDFTNGSTKYVDVLWNFGDGATATGPVVSHTFLTTGSYNVSVTASSNGTVQSTGSIISASVPVVTAGFTASPTSGPVPLAVQFTNTSVNANQYLWLFGTGSNGTATGIASSSLENPLFTFTTGSQKYTITLQATGSYNQRAVTSSIQFISASA